MTGRRSPARSKTPADGLVAAVRRAVPETCLVTGTLRKEGCLVRLNGVPAPRAIVDLDKPGAPLGAQETRCDYLFIADTRDAPGWLAPLELKRGGFRAAGVTRQLQAGADAAGQILPPVVPVRFRPIVVSRGTHKAERENLRAYRVRYRGVREPIRELACNGQLATRLRDGGSTPRSSSTRGK